jgi:hypothetical protein
MLVYDMSMREVPLGRVMAFNTSLGPFLLSVLPDTFFCVSFFLLKRCAECSEAMLESLSQAAQKLFSVFAFYMKESEAREVLSAVCAVLQKGPTAACRRSCSDIAATLCATYPRHEWEFCIVSVRPLLASTEWAVVHGALVLLSALAREASEQMVRAIHKVGAGPCATTRLERATTPAHVRFPPTQDPRSPLAAFGPKLIDICTKALGPDVSSAVVWQGGAELAARLAAALPLAVERLRVETAEMRQILKRIAATKVRCVADSPLIRSMTDSHVLQKEAGAGGRASALKALAAWGGAKV